MLKFSEIFEFSKEKFRKFPILKVFEWFEWFGPSPIEPFNSGGPQLHPRHAGGAPRQRRHRVRQVGHESARHGSAERRARRGPHVRGRPPPHRRGLRGARKEWIE